MGEVLGVLLVAEVLQWIGPEQIAHRPVRRRLFEPVQLQQAKSTAIELVEGTGL